MRFGTGRRACGGFLIKRGRKMKKLACGVVGVGQLGQHHARIYSELPDADLVGIYDSDAERMAKMAAMFDTKGYPSLDELLAEVEAVSLVVPTNLHYEIGKTILARGVHALIEKPITEKVEQGRELVELAHSKGLVLYTGHTERFSPSLTAAREWVRKPRFIEALRMAGFGARGTDVSVIHDLMIHDIDLVLSVVDSEIDKVDAIGVPVFTPRVDIANARISFADGTIASLTASRVSVERLRKLRFFQEDAYISVDFLKRDARIYRSKVGKEALPLAPAAGLAMQDLVEVVMPPVEEEEPLMLEIEDFLRSVAGEKEPLVPGEAGVRALEVVGLIIKDIESRLSIWGR
jgi:predicted dehydrogenase